MPRNGRKIVSSMLAPLEEVLEELAMPCLAEKAEREADVPRPSPEMDCVTAAQDLQGASKPAKGSLPRTPRWPGVPRELAVGGRRRRRTRPSRNLRREKTTKRIETHSKSHTGRMWDLMTWGWSTDTATEKC